MTRDEKVEALIEDWFESFNQGNDVLGDILRGGFKGYDNMTDEEVDKDYNDAFGELDDDEDDV